MIAIRLRGLFTVATWSTRDSALGPGLSRGVEDNEIEFLSLTELSHQLWPVAEEGEK